MKLDLRYFVSVGCLALMMLSGCGGSPLVPVSGIVLIEDKPLKAGVIRLVPDQGPPSQATIEADGKFTLKTVREPGAMPGEHSVEISAFEFVNKRKTWYAPMSYTNGGGSKLTAKIDGPTDNLTINLKWDTEEHRAKGYFVEAAVIE